MRTRAEEYVHPRATLMTSLGRRSRGDRELVFVTEMVAFFEVPPVFTDSVRRDLHAAYAYDIDAHGDVTPRAEVAAQ